MRKRAGRGPNTTAPPVFPLLVTGPEPPEGSRDLRFPVARFLQRLPQHERVVELLDDLAQTLASELELPSHAVFVFDESAGRFIRISHRSSAAVSLPETLPADCPIARFFQTAGAPWLDTATEADAPGLTALAADARQQLQGLQQQLAWPLISLGRLLGVLTVGARASGHDYSHPDKAALAWLAATTALALDRLLDEERLDLLGRISRGLAHDIQDLLTPFSTWAQLSATENLSGERMRSLLPLALRNLELLKDRIRHARRVALEAGLQPEPRRLDDLVRRTVADLDQELGRNELSVFYGRMSDVLLEVDDVAMKRVIANLLANAIAASPRNSQILIELSVTAAAPGKARWAELSIADQGKGIPPELLKQLATPKPGQDGVGEPGRRVGLGLAICRHIIAAHGGRLELRSAVGQGTRITVRLPIPRTPPH